MKNINKENNFSNTNTDTKHQILTITQVSKITTLSKSTIYRMIRTGSFPSKIMLSTSRSGFIENEVNDWIKNRLHVHN